MTHFLPPGIIEIPKLISVAEDDIPVKTPHRARFTEEGFAWSEFRGVSPPRSELGRVGDIWINLKRDAMSIHWKSPTGWMEWHGLDRKGGPEGGAGSSHSWILTSHPIIPTLYLWVRPNGSAWVKRNSITGDISRGSIRNDKTYRRMWPLPVRAEIFVSDLLETKEERTEDEARSLTSVRSPSSIESTENVMAENGGAGASIPNQASSKVVPLMKSSVLHTTSSLSLSVTLSPTTFLPVNCQFASVKARAEAYSHSRERQCPRRRESEAQREG